MALTDNLKEYIIYNRLSGKAGCACKAQKLRKKKG